MDGWFDGWMDGFMVGCWLMEGGWSHRWFDGDHGPAWLKIVLLKTLWIIIIFPIIEWLCMGVNPPVWDTQMFPSSCPWCGSTFAPDRRLHNDLERAKREQVGNGAVALDFRRLLDGSPAPHGMRIHVIWYTSIVVKSSIVLHFLRSPWDFQEPPEHFGGWCDRTVTLGTSGDGEKDRDFGWDLHSRRKRHTLQGRNDVVVYPLTTASS